MKPAAYKETHCNDRLGYSGFLPVLEHLEGPEDLAKSMTSQYCNGGDLESYFQRYTTSENREVLLWMILAQGIRAFSYLHRGVYEDARPWIIDPLDSAKAIAFDGVDVKYVPKWDPIFHKDLHPKNIFLHSRHDFVERPDIHIGDFGHAEYMKTSSDDRRHCADGALCDHNEQQDFEKFLNGLEVLPRPLMVDTPVDLKSIYDEIRIEIKLGK